MPTLRLEVVPVALVPVAAVLVKVTAALAAVPAALRIAVILSEAVLTTYESVFWFWESLKPYEISTNVYEKDMEHEFHSTSKKFLICFFHILQNPS